MPDLPRQRTIRFGSKAVDLAVDVSNVFNNNVTWDASHLSGLVTRLQGGVPGATINTVPQLQPPLGVLGPATCA